MNHFDQPQPEPAELTSDQTEALIEFDTAEKDLIEQENFGIDLLIQAAEEELRKIESKN